MRYLIAEKLCDRRSKHWLSMRDVVVARNVIVQPKFSLKLTHSLKLSIELARPLCHSWATCCPLGPLYIIASSFSDSALCSSATCISPLQSLTVEPNESYPRPAFRVRSVVLAYRRRTRLLLAVNINESSSVLRCWLFWCHDSTSSTSQCPPASVMFTSSYQPATFSGVQLQACVSVCFQLTRRAHSHARSTHARKHVSLCVCVCHIRRDVVAR